MMLLSLFTVLFYMPLFVRSLLQSHSSYCSPRYIRHAPTTQLYISTKEMSEDVTTTISTPTDNRTVTILQRGPKHIVAWKPPAVVCHHSGWTGSRAKLKRGEEPEIPMLQRVRDALHDIDTRSVGQEEQQLPVRKVNLIHRLDRGASGCLLLTYADDADDDKSVDSNKSSTTATLIDALQSPDSIKTYVALVRGEGILRGEDFKEKGWFEVSRPIKDESGVEKDATTLFHFIAGQPESSDDNGVINRARMSIVLARPMQGRWHQIRRHLNGISHPILGDTTHGHSKTNRAWKETRNLPGERICLHLARMQIPPNDEIPEGLDVSCPLMDDMLDMLRVYAPDVLETALPKLKQEGILLDADREYEVGKYTIPEELLEVQLKNQMLNDDGKAEILLQGANFVIADKPPTVVAHHSSWTYTRSDPRRRWKEPTPMLQRVRDETGKRVNLIHRLDRGASGALLFAFAQDNNSENSEKASCSITKALIEAMQSKDATKTYLALCDGDGMWNGADYLNKGWFTFDNPVQDENGKYIEDCRTDFQFIASKTMPLKEGDADEGRKITIVLARPHTGRYHQIRQHLSSGTLGHAILGDSSHGRSRTNRLWKKKYNLMKERVCLHLIRLQVPATDYTDDIDVSSPLPPDLKKMLRNFPDLMEQARPILAKEGIIV
mmetsp:Transcript_18238/g.30899  ORF Transcript_18238/g.30899 Transcript_18238/m.30899 type:complete len:665 (-) Transcript_18238:4-1998(-)